MQPKARTDYVIGYRRPPERNRFQPGRSGNPNGRPKGTKSFHDAFVAELSAKIFVTENGLRHTIRKREAIIKQIINKAVSGDPKMLTIILQYFSDELFKEEASKVKTRNREIPYNELPVSVLHEMLNAGLAGNPDTADAVYERYLEKRRQELQLYNSGANSESNSSTKPSP